jgi:hypothetical protein
MRRGTVLARGPSLSFSASRMGAAALRALVALSLLAILAFGAGCGGGASALESSRREGRDAQPLDLLPSTPEMFLVVRPKALLGQAGLAGVYEAVVSPSREALFEKRFGFAVRSADELVAASYPGGGELVLARGVGDARAIVGRAGETFRVERSEDSPWMRRGGVDGARARELVAYRRDTVLAGTGNLSPLYEMLDGTGKPVDERIRQSLRGAPLGVAWPVRMQLPEDSALGLVLAQCEAMAISLRPVGTGAQGAAELHVRVELWGEFPSTVEENLRALVHALSQTTFAETLGLGDLERSLEIAGAPGHIVLGATLKAASLAKGLSIAVTGEIGALE